MRLLRGRTTKLRGSGKRATPQTAPEYGVPLAVGDHALFGSRAPLWVGTFQLPVHPSGYWVELVGSPFAAAPINLDSELVPGQLQYVLGGTYRRRAYARVLGPREVRV
jgi:hypothetical protein